MKYGNDLFEIDKKVCISEKGIEWNYGILSKGEKKLSEYPIMLSVPLVVDDGRSALKVITEINHGVIFQWHNLCYILKYDNAESGMFDTNLSLVSVSGVSSNFKIVLQSTDRNSNYIQCSIKLFLIEKEEISKYIDVEDECVKNEYPIDIVAGMLRDCTGCGVCAGVCPQKCITMQTDDTGFRYPIMDKDMCTNCNVCRGSCPINNRPNTNSYTRPFVYAAYSSDAENRRESSSGGIFSEFAKTILENVGIVFAAKYSSFPSVAFSKIISKESIRFFHESKYVESELNDIFTEVKKELNTGKNVLFVGLPCQIAGLLAFLQKPYASLYTVDFVCGGVPSPLYFKTWICTLEELYQDQIVDYKFRNKALGWTNSISSITFSSGNECFIDKKKDMFYQDYQKGKNIRKTCFNCKFYGLNTVADITIGDFAGSLHYDCLNDDTDKGVSFICINSEKGNKLVQMCKKNIILKETNFGMVSRYNLRMKHQRMEPDEREGYLKNIHLFKERIYAEFNPNALCIYKVENPPEKVCLHASVKWVVYVQGTKAMEYAWYLYYNGNRIHKEWYSDKNTFEYMPEAAGEYYVTVFVKYKDDQDKVSMKLQGVVAV